MALAKELTEHSLPGSACFAGRDPPPCCMPAGRSGTSWETDGKLHGDWEKLIRKLGE